MAKDNKSSIQTKDLRATLKSMFLKELENMPNLLKSLEPKERLEILIKIMPFALPKVDSVSMAETEGYSWND